MSLFPDRIRAEIAHLYQAAKAETEEVARELSSLEDRLQGGVTDWLTSTKVLRVVFSFARRVKPIVVTKNLVIVTLYDDVREVLTRDADFSVVPTYAAKMRATSGDFVLGMDISPQRNREADILRRALRREDLATIAAIVDRECANRVAAVVGVGRFDAISELIHPVPARVVAEFFGVPGPDLVTQMHWLRSIFREIFLNPGNDASVTATALTASAELKAYLENLIAERKAEVARGDSKRDDFVTRLVRMQSDPETFLDDDAIRRNVGGVIVGAVDTISRSVSQALDVILDRPEELRSAHEAAISSNEQQVYAHAFESMRFNPQNPILVRTTLRETTIAKGTPRETLIPPQFTVIAATLSAMFDPVGFPSPDEYRLDRPDANYIFFGDGMHVCYGQYISRVEIPRILGPLYRLKNLRRAQGEAGKMTHDGPFPQNLVVEFDTENEGK